MHRIAATAALLAAACAQAPEPAAPPAPPAPPAAAVESPVAEPEADLEGRWVVVSVNGAAPVAGLGERRTAPWIRIGAGSYGGNVGCNTFGGLAVVSRDRLYGGQAMQTAMGCGPALEAQESAVTRLLASAPRVERRPDGSVALDDGRRRLVLRRDPEPAAPVLPREPPALLAGTRWLVGGVDGRWLTQSGLGPRTLSFEAERWVLSSPCLGRSGRWRQAGDRIEGEPPEYVETACPAAERALDEAVAEMLAASPRFATGPNGEILIGGGGHWLMGDDTRDPLLDQAALIAGSWRVVEVDGAPPVAGREPRLAFGRGTYSGGTGCNSLQGLFLAHARRLYTGWTVQTEMACGEPVAAQERRVLALLAASPRIALLSTPTDIALVDRAGRLLLRRDGAAPAADAAPRSWNGESIEAELLMLDGETLRPRHADPEVRLRLGAQRFDIDSGCAHLGGIWRRRGQDLEFLTDPERPPTGACGGALVERVNAFMRLGNGRFRALIGPSRELLIAGEDHWLAGRIGTPAERRR